MNMLSPDKEIDNSDARSVKSAWEQFTQQQKPAQTEKNESAAWVQFNRNILGKYEKNNNYKTYKTDDYESYINFVNYDALGISAWKQYGVEKTKKQIEARTPFSNNTSYSTMVNRDNQSLSKLIIDNTDNVNIVIDSGNSVSTLPVNDNPIIIVEDSSENSNDNAWNQFKKQEKEINLEAIDEKNKIYSNDSLGLSSTSLNIPLIDGVSRSDRPESVHSVPFIKLDDTKDKSDTTSIKSFSVMNQQSAKDKDSLEVPKYSFQIIKNETSAWDSQRKDGYAQSHISSNKDETSTDLVKEKDETKSERTFRNDNENNNQSAWKAYSKKTLDEIFNEYDFNKVIGKGYCGTIFKGMNKITKQAIAIKAESINSNDKHLHLEYAIYQRLYGVEGMPKVLYFGQKNTENIMIMELLGPSIESLFNICERHFSIKTVCMIGKQLLTRLEMVHKRGIIYRDIKPENFLIGLIDYSKPITNKLDEEVDTYLSDEKKLPPVSTVYLADFGLSEFYRDEKTGLYVPDELKAPCGTPRYMSLNTHKCRQQTPRDDIEALGYCLIYFLLGGRLPWMGIVADTPDKMIQLIGNVKKNLPLSKLCEGKPKQFIAFIEHVRKLGYYDLPDYDYLRGLMDEVLKEEGEIDDGNFDWISYLSSMREMQIKKRRKELEKERKEKEKEQKRLAKKNKKNKKEKNKEVKITVNALPNEKGMNNDKIEKENIPKSKSNELISKNNNEKQSISESVKSNTSSKRSSTGFKSRIMNFLKKN
ncbi:kinase-like protein [Neocallimastix lanati (nom. inval.)]|jgi:serine/threonine protein kinase|nr:kinase-like protein [Neocallimastix sp. JGI-2020a]